MAPTEPLFLRSPAPLAAPVGNDLVMLDPASGHYYGLDDIGQRIWELLAEPRSLTSLVEALTAEYDVDAETCRADVSDLVAELVEAALVQRQDA